MNAKCCERKRMTDPQVRVSGPLCALRDFVVHRFPFLCMTRNPNNVSFNFAARDGAMLASPLNSAFADALSLTGAASLSMKSTTSAPSNSRRCRKRSSPRVKPAPGTHRAIARRRGGIEKRSLADVTTAGLYAMAHSLRRQLGAPNRRTSKKFPRRITTSKSRNGPRDDREHRRLPCFVFRDSRNR